MSDSRRSFRRNAEVESNCCRVARIGGYGDLTAVVLTCRFFSGFRAGLCNPCGADLWFVIQRRCRHLRRKCRCEENIAGLLFLCQLGWSLVRYTAKMSESETTFLNIDGIVIHVACINMGDPCGKNLLILDTDRMSEHETKILNVKYVIRLLIL